MLLLIHSVEFSVNRIDRKGCWSWHVSKINIIFPQLYLLHFLFNMSTDSFFTWSRLFIPKKLQFRLLHRTWSPGWPVVAKNPLVLTYLDIPNRPSWKHFWIRLSRSELTVDFFEIVLDETNFDCALQIRMLISWTCKNLQQMLLVCRFSNWLFSNAISLNSFDKISMEMFLIKCGCYVKMFICVFDQFSSRHFERKYGSATAHLVFFCAILLRIWKQNLPLQIGPFFYPRFANQARINKPILVVRVFDCQIFIHPIVLNLP